MDPHNANPIHHKFLLHISNMNHAKSPTFLYDGQYLGFKFQISGAPLVFKLAHIR